MSGYTNATHTLQISFGVWIIRLGSEREPKLHLIFQSLNGDNLSFAQEIWTKYDYGAFVVV